METVKITYLGKKVTCNILERNNSDIIYGWILHEPYKKIPPQHFIARAFLTDLGFHQIGFTQKHRQLTPNEKENWMKLFRESASVVSIKIA